VKVSIITVAYNSKETVKDTIDSVLSQDYKEIEYLVVDGASTDGTFEIVKSYGNKISKFISEKDEGVYDAMNKGIQMASGGIIGILNSDDVYLNNEVLSTVVNQFKEKKVDSVFADLVYVNGNNLQEIVRYYSSANFDPGGFAYGWMPAHPTFFVKGEVYKKYGLFKTNYRIASDYEMLVRLLAKHKISCSYIPKTLVKMRSGGLSTRNLKSNWILNKEIVRACSENGISTNLFKVISKYPKKIFQLIDRPRWLS